MPLVYFITHPEVVIHPDVPVPQWPLSDKGLVRMKSLAAKPWVRNISAVYSSEEKKAIDGATVLAKRLNLPMTCVDGLGENDRSSTGYLPKEDFEAMADLFFKYPEQPVEGWERAVDAQYRIVRTVFRLIEEDKYRGDLAMISHGGVGTLLLCHLSGSPISRSLDQPGGGGGNVFCFDGKSRRIVHGWKTIEEM